MKPVSAPSASATSFTGALIEQIDTAGGAGRSVAHQRLHGPEEGVTLLPEWGHDAPALRLQVVRVGIAHVDLVHF